MYIIINKSERKDFKMTKEYSLLFNTITEMINELEELKRKLINVQIQAEELYIETNIKD